MSVALENRLESIPSEGGLEFKSMTVLFTDLKGSTELYERIGDMRAYGLVREHFGILRDLIAEQGGSMVKTIEVIRTLPVFFAWGPSEATLRASWECAHNGETGGEAC